MTTATTYPPVTVTELDRQRWDDHADLAQGQGIGMSAVGFTNAEFDGYSDRHPTIVAWEHVVDEAIAEISPQVGDLLYAALQKRLPWTWEPER